MLGIIILNSFAAALFITMLVKFIWVDPYEAKIKLLNDKVKLLSSKVQLYEAANNEET